jgi:molecular chaperone DnaK (HSP70)
MNSKVSRAQFENMVQPLVDRTIDPASPVWRMPILTSPIFMKLF